MENLAMRIWNSHDKCMEYIDDLYFFEEHGIHKSGGGGHFGEYTEPVMRSIGLKDKYGASKR